MDREDGRSLRSGFLRQAAGDPDAPALVIGEQTWTYRQIEHKARVWAHALLATLESRPARVGVLGYRSELSYAGTLAALFAGATFVPLNPTFPSARTQMMIELADLDAIIVERRYQEYLRESLPDGHLPRLVLTPDTDETAADLAERVLSAQNVDAFEPLSELPAVLEVEIAYLLFTSGSTGVPKGVPVMHANVLHFLDVMIERYGLGREDRFSQTFDQSFDLSVFDLFLAWEAGASVHVLSAIDLVAPTVFVSRHELTVWFSVPSIPALMRKKDLLRSESMPSLRWSLFCGEALPRETAEAWQAAAPNSTLENLYGPTELTIACFAYRWDPARSPAECVNELVPIGRPYRGLGAIIRDEEDAPAREGEAGELLVCGPQTVPGYWRAPEKTAERFLRLPARMATAEGETTFYATGDRVIRDARGCYAYLGRTDHQVKIRGGYRVELGEIESVLRGFDGVVEAVAAGWPVEEQVIQGIVAFVSGSALSAERILASAHESLPSYMVPAQVRLVERMPLNANGKIDRNALVAELAGEQGSPAQAQPGRLDPG
ncbi:MAG: amino acid adenylation domain-containing protein [Solirubrobacteraceae bacterium]